MKIIPRIYQKWATKAAVKGLLGPLRRALVVLATGLGKTYTAAFIAKRLRAKRTLFLVHNNFILKHAMDEFRLVFGTKVKMAIYNGLSKKGVKDAEIVFATWQTMGSNLEDWEQDYFDLVIVDEAHHTEADTYRPVVNYFKAPKLAITATPDRTDGTDIRDVFGPEVINITLEEAIARGWLPKIEYHVITDESLDEAALQKIALEIRGSKRRFTMAEVNRRIFIKKRDVEITRIINGYDEKALVFCNSIRHTKRMKRSLKLAAMFHSRTGSSQKDTWDKNQATLNNLKNGIVRRVCAVNSFNEGVNVPSIGLVAFCRVTGVITIFRQQLGRGLRPGKDKLIVLDFVGNLERIKLVQEMMNKISDLYEKFTPRKEIEREGYVRQLFEVSGKGFEFTFSDNVVDLMEVLEHCEREFYPTWQDASEAAKKLKALTCIDYWKKYMQNPRLPRKPHEVYMNFPGYEVFLKGYKTKLRPIYRTWQDASDSARKLRIKTSKEYPYRYMEDPKLPAAPDSIYKDFPGWPEFLSGEHKNYYPIWQQASQAAKKLGIRNRDEYRANYHKDSRLCKWPDSTRYPDFPGWVKFLGVRDSDSYYSTWKKASSATKKLKITSSDQYRGRKRGQVSYKAETSLPADPSYYYSNFPGWKKFLGKE